MTIDELRRCGIWFAATGTCFYVEAASFAEPKCPLSTITGVFAILAMLYLLIFNIQESIPELFEE